MMSRTTIMRRAGLTAGALLLLPAVVAGQAAAAAGQPTMIVPAAATTTRFDVIGQLTTQLAHELRLVAADPKAKAALFGGLITSAEIDPLTVLSGVDSPAAQRFTGVAAEVDAGVKQFEGVPRMAAASVGVYLYDPAQVLAKGQAPVYAAAPAGDDDKPVMFPAEDSTGRTVLVSSTGTPAWPVIIVDVNMQNVLPELLGVFTETLHSHGVLGDVMSPVEQPKQTILERIRVNKDQEPWHKFGAEMLGLVLTGQNGQARVDIVNMQYLNYDGKFYSPVQPLVSWPNSSWGVADFLIIEMDATACNAGVGTYATLVAQAVQAAGASPAYTQLSTLAFDSLTNKDTLCHSLYPNDLIDLPDFVDSFNGLTPGTVGFVDGSTGNGRALLKLADLI